MTKILGMSLFFKYHQGKSKPFSTKSVTGIASQNSSCFTSCKFNYLPLFRLKLLSLFEFQFPTTTLVY